MDGTTATGLSTGEMIFNVTVFAFSLVVSIAFGYYLLSDPGKLTEVWEWVRSLPLLVQGVIWLLFLPWMIALWVWTLPWATWLRLTIVLATLAWTMWMMYPWKG
jgi:hypothetical protein